MPYLWRQRVHCVYVRLFFDPFAKNTSSVCFTLKCTQQNTSTLERISFLFHYIVFHLLFTHARVLYRYPHSLQWHPLCGWGSSGPWSGCCTGHSLDRLGWEWIWLKSLQAPCPLQSSSCCSGGPLIQEAKMQADVARPDSLPPGAPSLSCPALLPHGDRPCCSYHSGAASFLWFASWSPCPHPPAKLLWERRVSVKIVRSIMFYQKMNPCSDTYLQAQQQP